jgi:hypothetical protein
VKNLLQGAREAWDPRHYKCLSRGLYVGDVPVLKRTLPTGYYLQKNYLSFLDFASWAASTEHALLGEEPNETACGDQE